MQRPRQIIDCGDFALRRWRGHSDLGPVSDLIEESLDHLRPWMPWVARHSEEKTRVFLAKSAAQWDSGDAYNYGVTRQGTLIGMVSAHRGSAPEPGGWRMGYWLHPAATGQGIATRAAAAMTAEIFTLPNVAYLEVVHDLANVDSGAVPRRLGFTEVRREQVTPPAAPSDSGIDVVWRLDCPASPASGIPTR